MSKSSGCTIEIKKIHITTVLIILVILCCNFKKKSFTQHFSYLQVARMLAICHDINFFCEKSICIQQYIFLMEQKKTKDGRGECEGGKWWNQLNILIVISGLYIPNNAK